MPKDKTQSHKLIMKIAKEEFLSQGYEKTSMREVAGKAGLTVGALYKHFSGKEEMFSAIVDPVYDKFVKLCKKQTETAKRLLLSKGMEGFELGSAHGTMQTLKFIYRYFGEFQMMFQAPKGSRYADIRERMVQMETESSEEIFEIIYGKEKEAFYLPDNVMHIFFTMSLTPLFEIIEHGYLYKDAVSIMSVLSDAQNYAWRRLIGKIR